MNFTYKTDAQIQAMTPAERDTYAAEKRAHESDLQKEAIKEATKDLSKLPETVKAEVKLAIDALKADGISKEQIEEIKESIAQIKEQTAIVGQRHGANFLDQVHKTLTDAKEKLTALKGTKQELVLEVSKAAITVTTTAVANAASTTTPDNFVYQSGEVNGYSEDVRKREYILRFLSNGTTDRATIPYADKLPNEGTMAVTAEGALKPLISISMKLRYSSAYKIAGRTKVTEEALDDIPFLMTLIRTELAYEYSIAEQAAVFTKVAAVAPAFVAGSLAGSTATPTNYDAIRAAIYAVKIASKGRYIPNMVLVPSADAYAMGATKDANRNYVMPPFVLPDGTKISGVEIVEVADGETLADGSFIVGDWKKLHRLVYKGFSLRIGQGIVGSATAANIVSDFESNLYTIIGEGREHLWIYENEKVAFIKSTFAAVKTAIASA
jgi:hypothetical protein